MLMKYMVLLFKGRSMWSVESHSFISPCGVDALTFTEDEIPKGMDVTHIKALHITVFF